MVRRIGKGNTMALLDWGKGVTRVAYNVNYTNRDLGCACFLFLFRSLYISLCSFLSNLQIFVLGLEFFSFLGRFRFLFIFTLSFPVF